MAIETLVMVESASWDGAARSGVLALTELIAEVCADQHHLRPLAVPQRLGHGGRACGRGKEWRTLGGLTEADRTALEFAEQFSIDVSSITDRQRNEFFQRFTDKAADLAATIFVMDFLPRTWAALDALPTTTRLSGPTRPTSDTDGASIGTPSMPSAGWCRGSTPWIRSRPSSFASAALGNTSVGCASR